MISWWWCLGSFMVGGFLGMSLVAVLVAGTEADRADLYLVPKRQL